MATAPRISIATPPLMPSPTELLIWSIQASVATDKELRKAEEKLRAEVFDELFTDTLASEAFGHTAGLLRLFVLGSGERLLQWAREVDERMGRRRMVPIGPTVRLPRLTPATAQKYIAAVARGVSKRALTPREGTALMYAAQLQLAAKKRTG